MNWVIGSLGHLVIGFEVNDYGSLAKLKHLTHLTVYNLHPTLNRHTFPLAHTLVMWSQLLPHHQNNHKRSKNNNKSINPGKAIDCLDLPTLQCFTAWDYKYWKRAASVNELYQYVLTRCLRLQTLNLHRRAYSYSDDIMSLFGTMTPNSKSSRFSFSFHSLAAARQFLHFLQLPLMCYDNDERYQLLQQLREQEERKNLKF